MNTSNIIRFQGGGHYTANGQRISAIEVDGGVFMHDQCRGLSYFYSGCPLEQHEIMRRYLNNEHTGYSTSSVDAFGQWALIDLMKWESK